MTYEERENWVKTLKVGDEVAVYSGRWSPSIKKVSKVKKDKRRRGGFVVLVGATMFGPSGYAIGFGSGSIAEVTDEIRKEVERRELVAKLDGVSIPSLPNWALREIADVCGRAKKERDE